MASDQFCLRWNNFQVNITSALENLKSDEDLVDVTLTCDGQNVKAHKVILSACSPYFRAVFKENPCQHPVVILKDVKFEDVTALLNFMYQGEVYITQDRLAPFLHTAELLQVRGLAGATNPFKEAPSTQSVPRVQQPPPSKLRKTVPQQFGPMRHSLPAPTNSSSVHSIGKPSLAHHYQLSKSPSVSPSRKELHPSTAREKTKDISSAREIDPDFTSRSFSPSGFSALGQQSSSSYHTASDPPFTPYGSAFPDQIPVSKLASPTSAAQLNDGCSLQDTSLPYSNVSGTERSSSQPTSPQPTAKKRKAFPRRLSASHSTSEVSVPSPAESDPRSQVQLMEEVDAAPEAEAPMKQEHMDAIAQDEDVSQEGGSPVGQVNPESGDVEAMELYDQSASNFEEQPLEQDLKDVSKHGDEVGEPAPQERVMPPLVDVQAHSLPQTDGLNITPKQEISSDEVLVLQPWNENCARNSNVSPPPLNWDVEQQVSDNSALPLINNLQVPCAKSRDAVPSVMQIQQTLSLGTNLHSLSSSSYSPRQSSRLLYQRRKHIWHSRRPVQCPNCHKTISMAYNLKSHLVTCVKRHGVLYNKL